jgi:putative flippase GtrA
MNSRLLREFCKAQISSFGATFADFVVTAVLFDLFGLYYVLSTFIGSVVGGGFNCIVNYKWTFCSNGVSKKSVAVRYSIVWIGSILLNTVGTAMGVNWFLDKSDESLTLVIGIKAVVAILVAIFWNFLMQKHFVYKLES